VFAPLRSGAMEFVRRAAHRGGAVCTFGWGMARRHASVITSLISGVILVFAALWFTDHLPRMKTYGDIWVESPQVYTRERLVNDRFRQEAWLLAQLPPASRIELPGLPASFERKQDRSGQISITDGQASKATGSAPTDAQHVAPQAGEPKTAPHETPARSSDRELGWQETLSAYVDFTEYVRNLLVENQLDDRHDLLGNSLYKLKFNVTVVPRCEQPGRGRSNSEAGSHSARFARSQGTGGTCAIDDPGLGRFPPR